jgi:dTDP-4-amino-4,6-dideoxygalactose transaminase
MASFIPVFKPHIDQSTLDAAEGALRMGWLGMGSFVKEFEAAVEKLIGADDRYAVALNTGFSALHLGLILAGVGPGDEVITPSFNNVSDFQAILACGAEPVFCDIRLDTLGIDCTKAEQMITKRTKVIIGMDYDLHLCDHEGLSRLAELHGLRILHDAAHSFGSYAPKIGKNVGAFSDLTMFSFDPVKTFTAIDGGVLVVKSRRELERLHELRLVGMTQRADVMYTNARAWTYDVLEQGYRYHMANLHGAIGLSQLAQFDAIKASRQALCRRYYEELKELPGMVAPYADFDHMCPFMYYIRVLDGRRSELIKHMKSIDIDVGIHWTPGHQFTKFRNSRASDLSVTNEIAEQVLTLPFHSFMNSDDTARVIEGLRKFFL